MLRARRYRFSICAAVCLAFVAFGWAADENPVEKDLALLQGEWTMESGVADGYAMPDEMRRNFKRIFKGNELTVMNGDQLIMKAKITIDPAKKPKTMDYEVIDGLTKGRKQLGIYQIDGDTFKSCFAAPDKQRPGDFESKPGDLRTATVWKRVKK